MPALNILHLLTLLSATAHALALPSTSLLTAARAPLNGSCWGQSCVAADISGSSGKPYTGSTLPKYSTTGGECCIANYNPAVRAKLFAQSPGLQAQCAQHFSITPPPITHEHTPWEQPIDCRAKTLIYARGTNEPYPLGAIGEGLKTSLQTAEPGKWHIRDSNYTNDIEGVFCLALEGGVKAKKELDRVAQRCPKTKFLVAGYSQGAMVAREAVGNSTNGHRVMGVLTFGDPFNGAPIKNYNGGLRVYCVPGDRVCYGEPIPTAAHAVYPANVTDAVKWILTL